MPARIRALERSDVRDGFACGEQSLDTFLARYAWQNQKRYHLGVTYVAVDDATRRVVGYFTAAMAAIAAEDDSSHVPPRHYSHVPALRVARLAVDQRFQGVGLGSELLYASFMLALRESQRVGCAGVIVDALPAAVRFYERYGFLPLSVSVGAGAMRPKPVPMYVGLATIERAMR